MSNNSEALRENELQCLNKLKDSFADGIKQTLFEEFNNSNNLFINNCLSSAFHNDNDTFPDFFFNGGIIEHFEVTPSRENRKGSQYKIDVLNEQKTNDEYFEQLDKEFVNSVFNSGKYYVKSRETEYDYFSYNLFLHSFKKNVFKHLHSLRNSQYANKKLYF